FSLLLSRVPGYGSTVFLFSRSPTEGRPGAAEVLHSQILNCKALCEVMTSKDLHKHGNTWILSVSDHFFFIYEDGHASVNTKDPKTQKGVMPVIGMQVYTN
uniref:Uncharacterized protein n=1 Tax=Ailuropoda melanoleuca TaxID=9646 RepID=A0A7N5KHE7_AILME